MNLLDKRVRWTDRAFMFATDKLWDKVDEYDALLEGRGGEED